MTKAPRLKEIKFLTLTPHEATELARKANVTRKRLVRLCGTSYDGWSRWLREGHESIHQARLERIHRVVIEYDFIPPKLPTIEPWDYINVAVANGLTQGQARDLTGFDRSWDSWLYGKPPNKISPWSKEKLYRIVQFMAWRSP
jgi:hypothetical protein